MMEQTAAHLEEGVGLELPGSTFAKLDACSLHAIACGSWSVMIQRTWHVVLHGLC
jgi:hypothetical protein